MAFSKSLVVLVFCVAPCSPTDTLCGTERALTW